MSGQFLTPVCFPPGERAPGAPLMGGWLGPKTGPDYWELNYDSSIVWLVAYSVFHEQTFKNLYIILKLVSLVDDIFQCLNNSLSTRRILSCVSTRGSCEASAIHGRQYLRAMDLGKVYWIYLFIYFHLYTYVHLDKSIKKYDYDRLQFISYSTIHYLLSWIHMPRYT